MQRILIKKGLDIPVEATDQLPWQNLPKPTSISLNLSPFEDLRFKLLVQEGDTVKIGSPLLENKAIPGQVFVSPAGGYVKEIRRGIKRVLTDIIIQLAIEEEYEDFGGFDLEKASREELIAYLLRTGMFPHIRMRPFDLIANPKHIPRAIFVKALETLPYVPSSELQISSEETHFKIGLKALKKLTSKIYLVCNEDTKCSAFLDEEEADVVKISGPHPSSNPSVHIHHIAPIAHAEDIVWTVSAIDVVTIGKMLNKGKYHIERVISCTGDGILESKKGCFKGRLGLPISSLIADRLISSPSRLISGDPLTGSAVSENAFLHFSHTAFTAIPENTYREPLHFLRLGLNKFSAHRAYLSGHVTSKKNYSFTTNQHGEERAFIDGSIYDSVMPMKIPIMFLIRAILAEDFELAEKLGLLEVTPEDFALATFICPSKIEMVEIVKKGLKAYSKEIGY